MQNPAQTNINASVKPSIYTHSTYNKLLFKQFLFSVWAILGFYCLFYGSIGAILSFSVVLIGAVVLSPLTLFLEKNGHAVSARIIFVLSCNAYIYFTSLGLGHLGSAEYYYLPAVMASFLMFGLEHKKIIATLVGSSFMCWLMTIFWGSGFVPNSWVAQDLPFQLIKNFNFAGAFAVSLVFLSIFIKTRNKYEQELEFERAKSVHNAKLASLGEMSAGIAHEINNPLAVISALAPHLVRLRNDEGKFKEKVESILKSVHRIAKIVNGLKKFSRASTGSEYKIESLDTILKEVLILTEAKSKTSSTPVELNIEPDLYLTCDQVEIEQVLVNLVNNGIDAIKNQPERWIKLSAFKSENHIIVRVMDSGAGISPEIEKKLFQPFFTTKPVGEGTGLGLSITKGILDNHKAIMRLNRDFKNTCFEIQFLAPQGYTPSVHSESQKSANSEKKVNSQKIAG